MKNIIFIILLCWLSTGSFNLVEAGETRIYDWNNQYIGVFIGESNLTIYSDTYEKLTERRCFRILIPTLNKAVNIDTFSGNLVQSFSPEKMAKFVNGDPAEYVQVSLADDCSTPRYLIRSITALLNVFETPTGYFMIKYPLTSFQKISASSILSDGICTELNNPTDFTVTETPSEFDPVELPFTLPLTLPLRFEYFNELDALQTGDVDLDGDVDGEDIATVANNFGQ